ncbi:NADPH-dependent ferric siderophore reductase [Orbus hercynius]|uniref:NADPH-dependent ferric siderophore reductase n=1 Tax=Orbus hercynius TaxID=593135 RepID=A0A495RIY8_9GAMM|nr:siderophore-interacting protein [Orbus hercynius]RKS87371.1 NADPH-dependent ferric siderophore reductase [Orbus hercynius]
MNKEQTSGHKRNVINGLLTVTNIVSLSSNLIRIVLCCDKKLAVDPNWIGPHLKLLFPAENSQDIIFPQTNEENKIIWQDGVRERVRTYSIRDYNENDNSLSVDFVVHQHGVATSWAQQAKIGDCIGLVAMGSKNRFDETVKFVLLGDIAAMPAICYTLEHLPAKQHVTAIIEVRDEQDKVTLNLPESATLSWLVTPKDQPSQLISTLTQLKLDTADSQLVFWGGMESSLAQSLRHYIKAQFTALSGDCVRLISYWREGYAEGQFKHHD